MFFQAIKLQVNVSLLIDKIVHFDWRQKKLIRHVNFDQ